MHEHVKMQEKISVQPALELRSKIKYPLTHLIMKVCNSLLSLTIFTFSSDFEGNFPPFSPLGVPLVDKRPNTKRKLQLTYMEELYGRISWTDIGFATKRRNRNSVFIQNWQIIAETAIHVTVPAEFGWQKAGKERYKSAGQQRLQHLNQTYELKLTQRRELIIFYPPKNSESFQKKYFKIKCAVIEVNWKKVKKIFTKFGVNFTLGLIKF